MLILDKQLQERANNPDSLLKIVKLCISLIYRNKFSPKTRIVALPGVAGKG